MCGCGCGCGWVEGSRWDGRAGGRWQVAGGIMIEGWVKATSYTLHLQIEASMISRGRRGNYIHIASLARTT